MKIKQFSSFQVIAKHVKLLQRYQTAPKLHVHQLIQDQGIPLFWIDNQAVYSNWDERLPVRPVGVNRFDVRGCEIEFIANWVDYNRMYTRTTCKQNMLDYIVINCNYKLNTL